MGNQPRRTLCSWPASRPYAATTRSTCSPCRRNVDRSSLRATDPSSTLRRAAQAPRRGSIRRGGFEETASIAVLIDIGVERPAREFLVPGAPDIARARELGQQLVEHGGDQRTAAKLAMDHEHQKPHGFVLDEILEGALVCLVEIARIGAQHAVVGEIRRWH